MFKFLKSKRFLIYFFSAGAAVLFFIIGFYISGNYQKIARAAIQELGGFAWSARPVPFGTDLGGPGWISFNCLDGGVCATSNYRVVYDDVSGLMSGYAWSGQQCPNTPPGDPCRVGIGWINFSPSSPYPDGAGAARINLSTGSVTGWARACAVFQSGCMGALKPNYERGGWDGWIKMAGTATDGSPYGLRFDNTLGVFLQGTAVNPYFAWGSDVIGWINFCVTPGTIMCVGKVGGALPPIPPATTTPPGGRIEIPPY